MRTIEYYIRLFISCAKLKKNESITVTRKAMSEELQCSERNVIRILNKMEEYQWINVIRGKGRGNQTVITFLKKLEEMYELYSETSPKTEDIERLILVLESNTELNQTHQLVSQFVNKVFGTKAERQQHGPDEFDSIRIPYYRSLFSLDPAQVERQTERHIVKQVFDTLVEFNEEKEEVEPCLSHYWEINQEGTVFTFYLRKGVWFHHSKKLIAEDVKFTFERLKQTASSWVVQNLKEIKCISEYVIQFIFTEPSFHWLYVLSSPKCSIIPLHYANKSLDEFWRLPFGTGPYKMQEHQETYLQLMVHEEYFKERAIIEEVSIFILPSIEKYLTLNHSERDPVFYLPFSTKKENH